MKNSGRKLLAGWSIIAAVLMLTASLAMAQQPAPKTGGTPTTSPAKPVSGADVRARVTESAIDASIPGDPPVEGMLAAYSPKVRELDVVLGKLRGELRKGGAGAGSLGNFVTDGMRAQAAAKTGKPITLALMNAGGMRRSSIGEGELRARDIFELLPFENALVTLDLTGEQLLMLLKAVVAGREAQSGARITYKTNADKKSELVSTKLRTGSGEIEIDPKGTYSIVTIDYLYRVGGEYSLLHDGKNMKELGITLRDAMMNYVKAETAAGREIRPNLDGRFIFDRAASAPTTETPNQ